MPEAVLDDVLAQLDRYGLLLSSDAALPSVVGMIVGEPLRTSWWGHPHGHLIYRTLNALHDHVDVLKTKLVAGKVTYVHRRLWPAVLAVGTARETWQMEDQSPAMRWLLDRTDMNGEVRTDVLHVPPSLASKRTRIPDLARELERRLLVHATEIHTPSGAHAKVLQTWQRWATEAELALPSISAAEAREALESAAERLSAATTGGIARLPWQRAPVKLTR